MNIKALLRISLNSIRQHKGRSILTILGIVVGIAAIITTLAIGYGAELKLRQKILGMGKNFIFIQSGKFQEGKTSEKHRKKNIYLEKKDVEILKEQCPAIDKITPTLFYRNIISYKKNNIHSDIKCGNQDYLEIIDRKIIKGSYYNEQQYLKSAKVIVLGYKAAKDLFGFLNPIGESVKIKNIYFKVIGIVEEIKNFYGIQDPNYDCYIPLTTVEKQLFLDTNRYIHGIGICAKNKADMPYITRILKRILRFKHRLKDNEPDDFSVIDQQEIVKAAKQSSNILNLLLLIIATISLFVGGIGVMNIMLVSVSERTQEIGIRMAIGATTKNILYQFLIESITLCTIGGIIGMVIGITTPYAINHFTKWLVVHKPGSILISFAITTLIGLIFGYYPAKKAAKLNVVDALKET
ncbi:ABC transporter permease [Candidatus Dependentiae bacterium]|nr:ABC transporter permease [Candidatus Dependentiae bacterium]MBU4386990.1 ABC transporter permease [Candidatus Dependentiae bacterium]MCG2756114.1 ABC transporter permease [Candidatus Dependentiae bacterium]